MTSTWRLFLHAVVLAWALQLAGNAAAASEDSPSLQGVQLAISVDDLPWVGIAPRGESPREAINRMGAVLVTHSAPATGFVVCARARVDEAPVRAWVAWGLDVGNHSERHADLNRSEVAPWLDQVRSCDTWLQPFGARYSRTFRFPMLHQGETAERRNSVAAALAETGLATAHVSVDTSDWILSQAYDHALAANDGAARAAIGQALVTHVLDATRHARAVAQRKLGRVPPLVLLLHANNLVADHLDEVLLELRRAGATFVPLRDALADPDYQRAQVWAGRKGLSWLYRIAPLSEQDAAWDEDEAQRLRSRFAGWLEPVERPAGNGIGDLQLSPSAPSALREVAVQAALSERMHSLLVMRGGEILMQAYFNGAHAETPANLKSITKTLLSVLTGIALRDGRIRSLDDRVADALPARFEGLGEATRAITLRNLLTMSSGLAPLSWDDQQASPDWLAAVLEKPVEAAHAGRFRYDTPVLQLMSTALTKAVGMPLQDYARTRLLAPLGARLVAWRQDPQGVAVGGNDAWMRARDLLSLGELLRNEGRVGGHQILDTQYARDSISARIPIDLEEINHGTLKVRGYGYLWWLLDLDGREAYAALGHGGQTLMVVPDAELVVVMTSRWPAASSTQHYRHKRAVLDALLKLFPAPAARDLRSPEPPAI